MRRFSLKHFSRITDSHFVEVASSSVSFNPKSSPHPKRIRVILALTELEVIPWINQREIRDELMLANVKSVPQDESRHSAHFQPFHLRNMPFVSSEYVLGLVQNYTFTIKVEWMYHYTHPKLPMHTKSSTSPTMQVHGQSKTR